MVSEITATETPIHGDDWNDEDPFSSGMTERPAPRFGGDTAATRVAADLQDDYERAGTLTLVDVTTLAQRRGLPSDDVEEVLLALAAAGVELSEESLEPSYDGSGDLDGGHVRRQIASVERGQLGAYLAAASRIRLLTAEQEV